MNIPEKLIPPHMTDEERIVFIEDIFQLWDECVKEYFDPDYAKRTHGLMKTNQIGCKGPFCLAAMRRFKRREGGHTPMPKYIHIEPIIDYFMDQIITAKEDMHTALQEQLLRSTYKDGDMPV